MSSSPPLSLPPTPRLLGAMGRESAAAATAAFSAIRKHWPLVVACAMLSAGGALLISKSLSKVYDANALVELNASVIRPLGDKGVDMDTASAGAWWDSQEYYETQYRIVTSQRVLTAVVRNLNLTSDLDFLQLKKPPPSPSPSTTRPRACAGGFTSTPSRTAGSSRCTWRTPIPTRAQHLLGHRQHATSSRTCRPPSTARPTRRVAERAARSHEAGPRDERELAPRVQGAQRAAEHVDQRSVQHGPPRDAGVRHGADPSSRRAGRSSMARVRRAVEGVVRQAGRAPVVRAPGRRVPPEASASSTWRRPGSAQSLLASGKGENHPSVKEATERCAGPRRAARRGREHPGRRGARPGGGDARRGRRARSSSTPRASAP